MPAHLSLEEFARITGAAAPKQARVRGTKRTAATDGGPDFDSRKEARRHGELVLLERLGQIRSLRRQVPYELIPKQDGERAARFTADFTYEEGGTLVVEDVKSPATKGEAYVLRRKLMLLVHGIRIRET